MCGFVKQININKFCREKHHFFLARKRSPSRKNTWGLSKYFHFCTIRSFCLHEPDFLISCRWTGLWPWKRKEFRPGIGKCPTNQRKARRAPSVLRNCPSACRRNRPRSAPLPSPATWRPWGICHRSATPDTSYRHLPPSTHPPASHSDTRTRPAWSRPWDKTRRENHPEVKNAGLCLRRHPSKKMFCQEENVGMAKGDLCSLWFNS